MKPKVTVDIGTHYTGEFKELWVNGEKLKGEYPVDEVNEDVIIDLLESLGYEVEIGFWL